MLAKKLVDEVVYSENGNDVLLIKYLPSSHQRATGTDTTRQTAGSS
jgi:hypothetical protein